LYIVVKPFFMFFDFSIKKNRLAQIAHNVPGCLRRFDRPNKQMRSICRAGKMWRSNGMGMSAANDLAVA
jgi:hypothetical protein